MKGKNLFVIWIIALAITGVIVSWLLASRFSEVANLKYIEIIITTAVFLAGFGLISLNNEDSVFYINIKQIIIWPILSIASAFCYIIFQSTIWEEMFFRLSSGFLFFTMTLIIILVLYHDSEYLKKPQNKS